MSGTIIQTTLQRLGLSLEDLSSVTDLPTPRLAAIAAGDEPTPDELITLSFALGLAPYEITESPHTIADDDRDFVEGLRAIGWSEEDAATELALVKERVAARNR